MELRIQNDAASSIKDQESLSNATTESLAAERMKQEQLSIVNNYAKGPGANEDSGDEDMYDHIDQYGFYHKAELVQLTRQEEERRRAIEVTRREKWLKMVRNWNKFVGTSKLTKRVYKGIPHGMRGDVWMLLLGVQQYMDSMPNAYQEMKTRAHSHSMDIRQIDLDVNRTYRDHINFKVRYSIKQQQLFHVLAAYSMYNTEVGYCQGMSQIAALLLMYMGEEEAFWALHSLLYGEKHRMHGFFIPGFPKLMRFQSHHDKILKKRMAKLKKHLDENEVFASLYTMKWFFQCFLDRTPFSLTLRLWDIYMLEGEKLLIAMSFTVLKMHKAYIKSQDMDGIVAFLQEQLVKDFGATDDAVIEYLKACMVELRNANLEKPPPPSEDEKPKLPFGAFHSSNSDVSSVTRTIPQFAKHSVDIATLLPKTKMKDGAKRKQVKRGKTIVTKNEPRSNGETAGANSISKGSKSVKEEHSSRSPFLRRSSRRQSKSDKDKKKNQDKSKPDRESPKKSESKTDSNKNSKSTKSLDDSLKTNPHANQEHSIELSQYSGNGKSAQSQSNGKSVMAEINEKLTGVQTDHFIQGEISHEINNSNSKNIEIPANGHSAETGRQSHRDSGMNLKTFVPPLLSSNEKHRRDRTTSHNQTPSSISPTSQTEDSSSVLVWRSPSPEKAPNYHRHHHHRGDSPEKQHYNKSSDKVRMRKSHTKSHSTDQLKFDNVQALQAKAPSFTQLTATFDSLNSLSINTSPVSAKSPKRISWNRPQSIYDNVPFPYAQATDYSVQEVAETQETNGFVDSVSSYGHGVEEVSVNSSESHQYTEPRNQSDPASQNKGTARKPRWRPVSMNPSIHPVYEDRTLAEISPEENNRSMDNLLDWTNRDKVRRKSGKPKNMVTSMSTRQIEPLRDGQVPCLRCSLSLDPKQDISSCTTSPFQQAVEDSGIIPSADKLVKSRRMSREEILTAAILSQMKKEKKKPKARPEVKQLGPNKQSSLQGELLNGWEADGGRMLSSPVTTKKDYRMMSFRNQKDASAVNSVIKRRKSSLQNASVINSPTLTFPVSRGWNSVKIDSRYPIHSKSHGDLGHPEINVNSSGANNKIFPPRQSQATKGVLYYSRHRLSADVTSRGIEVTRYDNYPTSLPKIDITRYPSELSPSSASNFT